MPLKVVPKSKLFDDLVSKLRLREGLDEAKRAATNVFNRHNNECGKVFAAFMQKENLPARTKVIIDGTEYMWATAESRAIDPVRWYDMWQSGEITKDQFFSCIGVGKKEAKLIIGEDQVEAISMDKLGTDADIRRDNANAGTFKGIRVETPEPITPPKGIRPRQPIAVQKPAPKRNIQVGKH